ncbi:unnamed protein product [Rotaria sordida]|nr:unnamed protein product [Rotaria sordida]
MMFFRQRGKILIDAMLDYHPIHLMTLFLNPRTRKMKQCTNSQRQSCLEYIKQEMIMFDAFDSDTQSIDNSDISKRKTYDKQNITDRIMQQYYEEEDEYDDLPVTTTAIHQAEIDNYLKFGIYKSNESCSANASPSSDQEYNPLHFWKQNHSLYPRLAKIAKRVFAVPATSAAVEREFSLAGNIVTKKRSKLSSETVNDIIFQNSFEKYKRKNAQNK